MSFILGLSGLIILVGIVAVLAAMLFREVVPTNQVHIVQSKKLTTSYGKDYASGNVYYNFPSWIPIIGVTSVQLSTAVFDINLSSYEAYDKQRLPFMVDVTAFFRINDSNKAAQRVSSVDELYDQLKSVLQGATRSILAKSEIEQIMESRAEYGQQFTEEVDGQLESWGVQTVKSIELMDIRDANGSEVIYNIMAKRKSFIEKESRVEVANNQRDAQIAEQEAQKESALNLESAQQSVGVRRAEKEQAVGISNERSKQNVQEEAKITSEKEMAVKQVEEVKSAEIAKEVEFQRAEEYKRTTELRAEGDKIAAQRKAEANLITAQKDAEGIKAKGQAEAEAKKLAEMAIVDPQIILAKEIGENEGYQNYLVGIRTIEKDEVVGKDQAKALEKAQMKILANTSDVSGGITKLTDVFTPSGGMSAAQSLETFAATEAGAALLKKFGVTVEQAKSWLK